MCSADMSLGEPLVAFEQIEVRLARVVYGPWQDLDFKAGHAVSKTRIGEVTMLNL
jgi:hypothetical protein